MNTFNEKYEFLKPYFCNDLKRLGRKHDGGYVVSQGVINNTNNLISFGLGTDWSFELDFLKNNNYGKVYVYDHTINFNTFFFPFLKCLKRFITFRKTFRDLKSHFKKLYSYYFFTRNKNINYFKKKISTNPSRKGESLKNIFEKNKSLDKFILKVDIEGSEFSIIEEILTLSKNIEMLIIEFHELNLKEKEFNYNMKKLINFFDIVHLHGNNHCSINKYGLPIALELTLLNKKYNLKKISKKIEFPLKNLDFPNNPNLKDISFSFN